ncbi:hypothetical protein E1B28_008681 [Marasmius oreades]|uniref:Zn(2)-C6 fungal-type domain-containing protein n=1 Tax=Marasmius oreades TaxID=181124 RepID=A0A9P7RZK5_9AGAR|nr:uncharacterized protein E1B28_008681 [Marasmius oreades]KAG7092320.1 hypothetical protein E1B28_008681 [Marasmius oreades]
MHMETGTVKQLLEDDSSDGDSFITSKGSYAPTTRPRSGACVHCKSLKVRCQVSPGETSCQRCQIYRMPCQPRSRKKRKPAPTHEDLQERAHIQDCRIRALLLQHDKMKEDQKIQGWFARASKDDYSPSLDPGGFFHKDESSWNRTPTPPDYTSVSHHSSDTLQFSLTAPEIVRHCSLSPRDISELFIIYFDRVNPFFSILDPELHKPTKLIHSSPFLFTVICSIASRYYTSKPGLYSIALEFARDAAGKALVGGQKGVDICQAYLLLGVYPVPKKKWADDRSWLFQGIAIRMAIELELNQPPPSHCSPRESLNRMRTWLNCYCVDGSHAIQFGKLPMLRLDDYLARTSQEWYRSSFNIPYDVHLVAYVQMIYIMSRWRTIVFDGDLSKKIQDGLDIVSAAIQTEIQLSQEMELWVIRYAEEYRHNPLPICAYRGNTTQMITAYLRLVVLSMGFRHAFKSGISSHSEVLKRSVDAARTVIQIMIERLYPTGDLRYAMEAHFLYVAYAAAYLVNLLRPKFLPLLNEATQNEIIRTVTRLIEILSSREVALDGRHTPALYSRFLSSLLAKYNIMSCPEARPLQGDGAIYPQHVLQQRASLTPPNVYSWPDIINTDTTTFHHAPLPGTVYQQRGEADMDFSLTHFMRTVGVSNSSPSYEFTSAQHPLPSSNINSNSFCGNSLIDSTWAQTHAYHPFHDWGRS